MKNKLLILLLFSIKIFSQSQTDFYDYIVTSDNDTIIGRMRNSNLIDLNGKKIRLKNYIHPTIKQNDRIFHVYTVKLKDVFSIQNDSLIPRGLMYYNPVSIPKKETDYFRVLDKNIREDFIITDKGDTLKGQIGKFFFTKLNRYILISDSGEEIKITPEICKQYRKDGDNYFYLKKRKFTYYDKKYGYLRLLYDGEVKLYDYSVKIMTPSNNFSKNNHVTETIYYLERNGELNLLTKKRFYPIISRVMPESGTLLEKIKNREFGYKDIYMIVKYFNENHVY